MEFLSLYVAVVIVIAGSHVTGHEDTELLKEPLDRVEAVEDRNRVLEDLGSVIANRRFLEDIVEGPVAFTALIDQVIVEHVKTNDTITFGHELIDLGRGYDNQTGVFTAPLPGIYMISCSLLDHWARHDGSGVMLHAEIIQEGQTLARVFAHAEGTSYRDQGAQTIVVQAAKGDRFYVRIVDNPDLRLGGQMYSTFSGYLLWQM